MYQRKTSSPLYERGEYEKQFTETPIEIQQSFGPYGHDYSTTSASTAGQYYYWIIPIADGTITYTNAADGQTFTNKPMKTGVPISGRLHTVSTDANDAAVMYKLNA